MLEEENAMTRFAFALSLLFVPGCVLGDRHVALGPVQGAAEHGTISGKSIALSLADARDRQLVGVVGHTKNGYGIKMAAVLADKEPTK
jgi:hypothetical protein